MFEGIWIAPGIMLNWHFSGANLNSAHEDSLLRAIRSAPSFSRPRHSPKAKPSNDQWPESPDASRHERDGEDHKHPSPRLRVEERLADLMPLEVFPVSRAHLQKFKGVV